MAASGKLAGSGALSNGSVVVLDFASISAGVVAFKTGLDTVKSAIGIAKEAKDLLPSGDHKDKISETLDAATIKIAEGEAAVAQALGYTLCRCEFPPTPRLLVGYIPFYHMNTIDRTDALKKGNTLTGGVAVHECPKCKVTDAPGYKNFQRTTPGAA